MKPSFHPQLVNSPFEDPALYVDFLFRKRALLFDLGDIGALAPRKILRLSDVFVSHTHMDHFIGFDHLIRICLGRPTGVHLVGPPGFIAQVGHRLAAYTWNLVENYEADFTVDVSEVDPNGALSRARFRCRSGFAREDRDPAPLPADGTVLEEESLRVRTAVLDHRIPCLAFALEEHQHVNVWKNRLEELGLPTGPWLQELKSAIARGEPDDRPFRAWWRSGGRTHERWFPLGELKARAVRITRGQKIAYVVDALYSDENAERIVGLVRDADYLFIEAAFLEEERERAARTCHLTARQAGLLAREARVKTLVPFHFSPRHEGAAERLEREALQAWRRRARFA